MSELSPIQPHYGDYFIPKEIGLSQTDRNHLLNILTHLDVIVKALSTSDLPEDKLKSLIDTTLDFIRQEEMHGVNSELVQTLDSHYIHAHAACFGMTGEGPFDKDNALSFVAIMVINVVEDLAEHGAINVSGYQSIRPLLEQLGAKDSQNIQDFEADLSQIVHVVSDSIILKAA